MKRLQSPTAEISGVVDSRTPVDGEELRVDGMASTDAHQSVVLLWNISGAGQNSLLGMRLLGMQSVNRSRDHTAARR